MIPEHPTTEIVRGNLRAQGDPVGARVAFQRALAILEARLPQGHPDIETVRANLQALV